MNEQKKKELTEEEKLISFAKREYARQYRAKNREKIKKHQMNFYLKKAKEMNLEIE